MWGAASPTAVKVSGMGKATKLSAYAAKRDFQKTAEPSGEDDPIRPSQALRFVVQRHDATRLHYDLRLELDGVFKSWAVTKGPSLNPADKRLAVEVEDHPLGYGDFEGTIPKGQYGGGTVQLFDRGTWAPEGDTPPDKALAGGELKFVLKGKRLKGSFVLVRMKKDRFGGKRTNWLLIKHRDGDARDEDDGGGIPAIEKSVASGRTLATIAAGKGRAPKPFMLAAGKAPAPDAVWDSSKGHAKAERVAHGTDTKLSAGKAPKTAGTSPKAKLKQAAKSGAENKAADTKATKTKATMPDFVPPQFCRSVEKPPSGRKWLHEIKFDGYRTQLRIEGGAVRLLTRTGLDWTDKFGAIAKAARGLPDALIDGEIVALDGEGQPNFSALQAAISAGKTDALSFFAFDLLFAEGADLRRQPLATRKEDLSHLLASRKRPSPLIRYVEHFDADGPAVFESAKTLGLEGIVSKQTSAIYRSGKSESWTKTKCRAGHEVVLGAWTETNGHFRSLLAGVFRDGKLAYVGRVGTGYGAKVVAELMPKLKANEAKQSPFDKKGAPPRDRAIHWLKPDLVAEIEFAGWSADGVVRQAAFKGLRDDKPAADVVAETPVPAKEAEMPKPSAGNETSKPAKGKSGTETKSGTERKSGKVEVMGVALSHPDKPLWPDAGDEATVTKRDLADYFEAVGGWMLPHIEGRPCSIIRAPDGIDGQTFFQRHAMAGGSKLFDTLVIEGDREPYLVINEVAALAAVAQSGGLELHPLNSIPGKPDVPGRLVFDLDPAPDVDFADTVVAAKDMKARLEALGLAAFCKSTGGKGLHVVTPLAPDRKPVDWDAAKRFAHDVVLAMERDAPKLYLTKASKAARAGRIYLDYLRNDRLSTAVAPLSPRARPHAPVSMPLTWSQVKADLDPARFTIRTVPKLIAKSTAWDGYAAAAGSIAKAIAALGKTA